MYVLAFRGLLQWTYPIQRRPDLVHLADVHQVVRVLALLCPLMRPNLGQDRLVRYEFSCVWSARLSNNSSFENPLQQTLLRSKLSCTVLSTVRMLREWALWSGGVAKLLISNWCVDALQT